MDSLDQRFIKGGEEELEKIINLYGEKLLRYATTILCDYHEAENIVQEVFITAYENRTNFDGGNLSAWLYKITYNKSLNYLKKRKIFYFAEVFREINPQEEDQGLSDEVLRALQKLKPKDRAVLHGRIMENLTYEELSSLTGSSPAALRKQYQRAKEKLAKYLNSKNKYYREGSKYEQV